MSFRDRRSDPSIASRIVNTFEDFLAGNYVNKAVTMATPRQAEGFILYTADTPIFRNGVYSKIQTASYDLSLPQYRLVTATGTTGVLQNTTIYVSIDPKSSTLNPTLVFSFSEPTTPTIAVIFTDTF